MKIEFNLEKWKSGKYNVVTRNNDKAKIIYVHDDLSVDYPIAAIIFNKKDFDCHEYNLKGQFLCPIDVNDNEESCDDLFLIPKTKKFWIAVSKQLYDQFYLTSFAFISLEMLKEKYHDESFRYIEIEVEDQENDN